MPARLERVFINSKQFIPCLFMLFYELESIEQVGEVRMLSDEVAFTPLEFYIIATLMLVAS